MYKEEGKKMPTTGGIIVIRSLIWPGAYVLYQNDRWFNFYVGYGDKSDRKKYYPVLPPTLQTEPIEPKEQDEPNPKELPPGTQSIETLKDALKKLEDTLGAPEKIEAVVAKAFDEADTEHTGQLQRNKIKDFLKLVPKAMEIQFEADKPLQDEFLAQFIPDESKAPPSKEEVPPKEEFEKGDITGILKGYLEKWAASIKEKVEKPPAQA